MDLTREMVIDALTEDALAEAGENFAHYLAGDFRFFRNTAERLGIPHAKAWRLHCDRRSHLVFSWRVIDTGAPTGDGRDVVIAVPYSEAARVRAWCESMGRALRAAIELRDGQTPMDLTAPGRR
jgi:hypothetical protein